MTAKKEIIRDRKAVYTGRRLMGPKQQVYQCFEILPDRKEMFFRGVKGVWIGYTYECSADSISARPKRVDAEIESKPEWEAADTLVDATRAQARAEAKLKAKASPQVKKAIEVLIPLVKRLSFFEARALVGYLADEAKRKSK